MLFRSKIKSVVEAGLFRNDLQLQVRGDQAGRGLPQPRLNQKLSRRQAAMLPKEPAKVRIGNVQCSGGGLKIPGRRGFFVDARRKFLKCRAPILRKHRGRKRLLVQLQ